MKTTLITALLMTCALTHAEHEEDEVQTDSRGRELPVLMPKHVDEDGHAATHADMIDPLHAASLLFPDDLIEQIECEHEAEESQRRQRRFRLNTKK